MILELVTDPESPDIVAALELYDDRIPESARFESPDVVRWLREGCGQPGTRGPKRQHYFLVTKRDDGVVSGFVLIHYFDTQQLAFVAYLVAAPDATALGGMSVSLALIGAIAELLKPGQPLEQCKALLFEVDRPSADASQAEWLERLGRIKHFCTLAEARGIGIRAVDIDYIQPTLDLARPTDGVPMVLMYGFPPSVQRPNCLKGADLQTILTFIYTELYPAGYSADDEDNRQYKALLQSLLQSRYPAVASEVPLLDFKRIKTWVTRPSPAPAVRSSSYKYDAFVSYRREEPDLSFARGLVNDLEGRGFKLAIDERDFDPTAHFVEEMERCMRESRLTICVLSPRYFESGFAHKEAIMAQLMNMTERSQRLLPVVCEPVKRPAWLFSIVGIDFTQLDPLIKPMDKLRSALAAGR
jgi:hypothetical protein